MEILYEFGVVMDMKFAVKKMESENCDEIFKLCLICLLKSIIRCKFSNVSVSRVF